MKWITTSWTYSISIHWVHGTYIRWYTRWARAHWSLLFDPLKALAYIDSSHSVYFFLHKPSIISFLVYFSKHVPLCLCALISKLPFNKSIGIYTIWPKLITHSYLFSRLVGSRISQFQFRTKKQHIFYLSQISFSFCYIFCYSLCKPYS